MDYNEAAEKLDKYKYLIGKPLADADIQLLIISTFDDLGDVVSLYYSNGYDNKRALIDLNIIDKDLQVYLFPSRHLGLGLYSELESYLRKTGS